MRTATIGMLALMGFADAALAACTSSTEYEPTTYYSYPCHPNVCSNYGVNVIPEEDEPGNPQWRQPSP